MKNLRFSKVIGYIIKVSAQTFAGRPFAKHAMGYLVNYKNITYNKFDATRFATQYLAEKECVAAEERYKWKNVTTLCEVVALHDEYGPLRNAKRNVI